jgi:hypothetical protein
VFANKISDLIRKFACLVRCAYNSQYLPQARKLHASLSYVYDSRPMLRNLEICEHDSRPLGNTDVGCTSMTIISKG